MVLVAVQLSVPGLYLPPVFKKAAIVYPAPDDHFAAGPDCRVIVAAAGALVVLVAVQLFGAGIVSPAGVQIEPSALDAAPDDHFAAGPNCRCETSASGGVGGAGGCPTVCAGIISPAGIQSSC